MPAQLLPLCTKTCPFEGTTWIRFQPGGMISSTVCMPGETLLKRAAPVLSFCVVCWPPSRRKVNCGTTLSSLPLWLNASFRMSIHPICIELEELLELGGEDELEEDGGLLEELELEGGALVEDEEAQITVDG